MQHQSQTIDQDAIVKFLTNLAAQHRLIDHAIEGCNAWFKEEPDGLIAGWSSQDLTKQFFTHSLIFKHASWDLIYINTTLRLFDKSGEYVGEYRRITLLNGDVDDDYLILDRDKASLGNDGAL